MAVSMMKGAPFLRRRHRMTQAEGSETTRIIDQRLCQY